MKVSDLFEASPKKDTASKVKTKAAPDMSAFSRINVDQPLARTKPAEAPSHRASTADKELRTASKAQTAKATANISLNKMAHDLMANIKDIPGDDEVPAPRPPSTELVIKPAAVPAHIRNALKAAGVQDPDFHLVSSLPGNIQSGIRQLGKALFKSFTSTTVDNISMIGNLGGQGPNSTAEVNAVAGYLKQHGEDLGPGNINFDNIMPGYEAKIHNYEAEGIHYMLVKDTFGNYIYTWPARDSVGHGTVKKLDNSSTKKLR
jgi:hypothetical protein